MRTPIKWSYNLKNRIIMWEMLEAGIFSVNKRAKNWRDKKRECIHYRYASRDYREAEEKEMQMYEKKEQLLSVLSPRCIHQEFAGYARERIYSDNPNYEEIFLKAAREDCIVWMSSFTKYNDDYDDCNDYDDCGYREKVYFFDRIDRNAPESRWYLYYEVGKSTFHSPIKKEEVHKYQSEGLSIVKIPTLSTEGKDIKELISLKFVDRMLTLIRSKNYHYVPDKDNKYVPEFPIGWDNVRVNTIKFSLQEARNYLRRVKTHKCILVA